MVCDYSKGKIYTIRSLTDDNVYIGSTIQSLSSRMTGHRSSYKRNKVLGLNKEIVKDINDWYIELYEMFPCNEKCELHKKEGEIIRLIGTLNKTIAGRTIKERYNDNIEKIKEYYIDNSEHFKEYGKEYYNNNIETFKQKYINNSEKLKQYYIDNAAKRKKYQLERYYNLKLQKKNIESMNKKMIC